MAHALASVGAKVARHLAAAHGKSDQGGVTKVELGKQVVQVLGEGVVIVAEGRLAGVAEASAVVGDDPVPGIEQRRYLLLPGTAAQRPAMD